MSLIEIDDGVFADEETGEIVDIPAGTDRCLLLARKLDEASTQIAAWTKFAAVAKAGLIRYQSERRAEYDGLVVRIQQNQRSDVDASKFADFLDSVEAPREVLMGLLKESKIPAALVPTEAKDCITHSMTKLFVVAEKARKRAPGTE